MQANNELLFTLAKIPAKLKTMGVKWLARIAEEKKWTAVRLREITGATLQAVRKWLGLTKVNSPVEGMNLRSLCRIRKESGRSWEYVGKLLDNDYLGKND